MRVLMTGGAGYVGSILCERLLDAGLQVTVIDNLTYGPAALQHLCHRPSFDFVQGDVRDEAILRKLLATADVVIPLAAIVGAPACERSPRLAKEVNLDAVRLVNRLRGRNQLVIYPNTNSGYGSRSTHEPCTEDTPLEPVSLYGRTKTEAEAGLLASPNTISLRLATVFGASPRMRFDLLVNHFVYAAATDGYIVLFERDFKRNYLHIRDAADCFLFCIENAARLEGRAYNVGLDNANLSKLELAEKVREHLPRFFIHAAAIGTDPDQRNYIVSSERLRSLGFEARRTLDEGIREILLTVPMAGRRPGANI